MNGFVLVTAYLPGSGFDPILEHTLPRMAAYAEKWEMEFCPYEPSVVEVAYFDHPVVPPGTGCDYASIPWQIRQLDRGAKGICFLDADVLILSDEFDLCREVTDNVPIKAVVQSLSEDPESLFPNWGVVVGRGPHFRDFLHWQWAMREEFRSNPWLEQAAAMTLIGFDPCWPRCVETGGGLFVDRFGALSPRWNWGPRSIPLPTTSNPRYNKPLFFHPTGLPTDEKIRLIAQHTKETEHTWRTT